MAILVDSAVWPWRGRRWAHLVSDSSYEELHDFAGRLGVPRRAFQGDHYDLPAVIRDDAVALGAIPVDGRELVRRLRAAGLRRRPVQRTAPPVAPPSMTGPADPARIEESTWTSASESPSRPRNSRSS